MKPIIRLTFFLTFLSNLSWGQCISSIDSVLYNNNFFKRLDTIYVCKGEPITLYLHYGCNEYVLSDNFNNGTLGNGWSSNCNPMFNNPCGPGPDGSIYCWVGSASSFPRRIITNSFNVNTNTTIQFDMKYASQSNSSPCEGPDESTEGVHFQYSLTSSNGPWTDIAYWDPNGGNDPILTEWQHYSVACPVSGTVWFSWYQDVTSGNDYDHWGIDNVNISLPIEDTTAYTALLYKNNTLVAQNVNVYTTVLNQSTIFKLITFSNNALDTDQIYISVYDPFLTIQNLASTYYLNSPLVTLLGTPAPGYFTGNGIVNGNVFDPAAAGPGTHTITYHHIYLNNNHLDNDSIAGSFLFFDDFSTDKGWTGYGTEWTRGPATASSGCSGSQDPSTDHTATNDNYLLGNRIGNCYSNTLNQTYWITSPSINCMNQDSVFIVFYSHSGVESSSYDHMYIQAYNGSAWYQIWSNTVTLNENTWTLRTYFVPQATYNPNFKVRFGIGPVDGSIEYKGWNIDDFGIWIKSETYDTIQNICEFTINQQVTVLNQMSINNPTLSNDLFPAQVSIITADGRTLFTKEIDSMEELYQSLHAYSEGLYFYKIHAKNLQIGKLIYAK